QASGLGVRSARPAGGMAQPAPARPCPRLARLRSLRTPCREGVLEAEEVEESVGAVAIAVGAGVERGEEVLEAEEIEEREIARAVAVGVAGARAAPTRDAVGSDTACEKKPARRIER